MKKYIYDWSDAEIASFLKKGAYPSYRAEQIRTWLNQGVADPLEMSNLPLTLREQLAVDSDTADMQIEARFASKKDETCKYVFRLSDGNRVEAVYMVYRTGTSVCVSSQAGCQMGCTFCASSKTGFGRNLTAGEMLAQVALIGRDQGRRIDNMVLMGIGEPFQNFAEVMLFLDRVSSPEEIGIGKRHLTVSTCGLVPEMIKFAEMAGPVTLAISLHAPNDQLRRELMPIAKLYPLEQLMDACRYVQDHSTRRLTFEYALFRGVNDKPSQARELAGLLRGMRCHVNLIPANEMPDSHYQRSTPEAVAEFKAILDQARIACTVRRELGKDIQAACGQLRRHLEADDFQVEEATDVSK